MSLQLAAQHLASKGRGPDTTLVHMAPQEVAGLQALARAHGGTLTVNPETGLAEAGFLKNLLPTIIGAGLSMIPGVGPLMAAGIVGGGTALATGDLGKGLKAGLGAYGGAGLGAGLSQLGSTALAPEAITAANAAADPIASLAAAKEAAGAAVPLTGFDAISAGARQAFNDPSRLIASMGGNKQAMQYGLSALSPMMMSSQPNTPPPMAGPTYEYTYNDGQYTRVPVGTRDTLTKMPSLYAAGGPIEEMSNRNEALTLMADGGQMYADGGMAALHGGNQQYHLGDYSDGGRLLKGPGDGVSDSIPATIAGKRPARLADGEFVVPARIVSELGNGSTEAGARKLYAMMDRVQSIRKKSIGKDRVAVNSRADKALPA